MSLIDKALFKIFSIEPSYSQSGEDKILKHLFNSVGRTRISYLDIGANHPQIHNNTYLFYRTGSTGVCVEPNPSLAKLIGSVRPRDVCLNVGIGTNGRSSAEFYLMSSHTLSTFNKEDAEALSKEGSYRIEEVLPIPLVDINVLIRERFDQPVDLVSLDVEGWNEEIMTSFDFSLQRPFCFCAETLTFSNGVGGKKLTRIIELLERNDYEVYADTHINTIFVDRLAYSK